MNEKICPKCGKLNSAEMSFCLDCGQNLAAGNYTPNFPVDSAPTVFASPKTQPNWQQNLQPLTPNLPPAPKKSRTGFWLAIVGGVGLIGVLLVVGVVALIAMNWKKNGDNNKNSNRWIANASTPFPVNVNRANNRKIPVVNSNRNTSAVNTNIADTSDYNTSAANTSAVHEPDSDDGSANSSEPNGEFYRTWIDYNVTENNQKGMRIHTKFTANNMKGVDSYLAIYFETRDGVRLKDKNKKLYSTDGSVAVYRALKPGYDVATFDDLDVFIPYDELDLKPGDYKLRMDIDLIYKPGGLIQHLSFYNFDYKY